MKELSDKSLEVIRFENMSSKMKKDVVVIIPIYQEFENLSSNEKRSMAQCFDVLNKRTMVFVCSNSLDTKQYQECAQAFQIMTSVIRFKNAYFSEISGYNKLMLDQVFYQAFREFKFMFIYQLDAWVFRDELDIGLIKVMILLVLHYLRALHQILILNLYRV